MRSSKRRPTHGGYPGRVPISIQRAMVDRVYKPMFQRLVPGSNVQFTDAPRFPWIDPSKGGEAK